MGRRLRPVMAAPLFAAALMAGTPPAAAAVGSSDYSIAPVSGQYEDPPANATDLQIADARDERQVSLPFEFPYWGVGYSDVWVMLEGMVQFGIGRAWASGGPRHLNGNQVAEDWPPEGVCAPHWADLAYGTVLTWTAGTEPNRRFIVSWSDVRKSLTNYEHRWFQAKFHESTGKIVFAYRPDTVPSTWVNNSYACGVVAAGDDDRWAAPVTYDAYGQSGHPSSDWELTPRTAAYTGRIVFDRIVPGESGIPSAPRTDEPAAGVRVELRYTNAPTGGNPVAASAVTDDDGNFSFTTFCGKASLGSELHVIVASDAAEVRTGASATPVSVRIVNSIDFGGGDLGTLRITAASDPSAAVRAPLAIHGAIRRARNWAVTHTTAEIPAVVVEYQATGTTASVYDAPSGTLRVAGPQASNPDAWDEPVVIRLWGRHLLAALAAAPAGTPDDRFGAITTPENAFASAFGFHVWTAATGSTRFVDGTGPATAGMIDLESPVYGVTPGTAVTATVAEALHDLTDAANETWDEIDGSSAAGSVIRTVDGLAAAPTADSFRDAWTDGGRDGAALTRLWIGTGLLHDDTFEPNDRAAESASLGTVGFVRRDLTLHRFQEDWFSVVVPPGGGLLVADVVDESGAAGNTIALEIRSAGGELLATGAPMPAAGGMHAWVAGASAGSYRIVVRHVSGPSWLAYSLQTLLAPSMNGTPLRDWTVGRPYEFAMDLRDGIPPFQVAALTSAPLPPGLFVRPDRMSVAGVPQEAGEYGVTIQATDSGHPANVTTRSVTVTIHDELRVALPGLVGFPVGRPVDTVLPTTGGTPPLTFVPVTGSLPAGLGFESGTLRVVGTAESPGSTEIEIDGVDAAGSADRVAIRAVAAVDARGRGVPAPLEAGLASAGWWFDAVEGSTVSVSVATAKKQPRRAISGLLLGPDRAYVPPGSVKAKPGALSAAGYVCPASGRYVFVASSQDDGVATGLAATVTVAPPRKAKAGLDDFSPDDTTEVRIGALPGSRIVVKFAGQKKTSLVARVHEVRSPEGTLVSFLDLVKLSPLGGTLTLDAATGGTWVVVLGGRSPTGETGKLTWSYTVRAAKGAVWSAD